MCPVLGLCVREFTKSALVLDGHYLEKDNFSKILDLSSLHFALSCIFLFDFRFT
jgi:hypothetical protein